MKKIVVITGSPRKNGNSFAMTKAFIQAAEAKGHTVTRFDAAQMSVNGCTACHTCYKTDIACSYKDDFNLIAPTLVEADVVVFTMPLYWFSFPGKLKNVIDKIYSLVVGGKNSNKQVALITCGEINDSSSFDGLRIQFKRIAAYLKWEVLDMITIPGVNQEGDIYKTDGCQKAIALAELLLQERGMCGNNYKQQETAE